MGKDIVLTVDYHDQNCVIRRLDRDSGEERVLTVVTCAKALLAVVDEALAQVGPRKGRVVWIQESTTGWARVKDLLGERVEFLLVNLVQMPLPPKARRRKTDKLDTGRMLRNYLTGELPLAHQPPAWWRQVRRLVGLRENLVNRRTGLQNWVNRYLAHETWENREGLWSVKGRQRLRKVALCVPPRDGLVLETKLAEWEFVTKQLEAVVKELLVVYAECPEAQRVDAIKGIAEVSAVSIVARIGPIQRFGNAEQLIAYAGLAPGIRQSDQTRRDGHLGGGGTDGHLRYYVIEATLWARRVPRYQATYERVTKRRGKKIGRLVVARLLLRSIYKMLRDGVPFDAKPAKRTKPDEQAA
jgi:transposase